MESVDRLNQPFFLPQTNFYLGNVSYKTRLSNAVYQSDSNLNESGITTYGFDIEVNSSRFMNIGATFRIESLDGNPGQDLDRKFSALLGGFTRFFYLPSILQGKGIATNVFTRLELGGGPAFFGIPSGLMIQGGVHVGLETYFNKWFGVGLSYGYLLELGRDTLYSGLSESDYLTLGAKYKDASLASQGQIFLISFKTTFF